MSRNMVAGRAKLTEAERTAAAALQTDDSPESQDRVFHEQLRIARQKIKQTKQARRERGRR